MCFVQMYIQYTAAGRGAFHIELNYVSTLIIYAWGPGQTEISCGKK